MAGREAGRKADEGGWCNAADGAAMAAADEGS